MNTRAQPLLAALAIAVILPVLSSAHAAPPDASEACNMKGPAPRHEAPEMGMLPETPPPPFLHGVALTEAQQDAIFKILHADLPVAREKMKITRKAQESLQALAFSDKYDEHKAKELAETIADNMAVLALMRARSESRIHALLTPEQRKQASEAKSLCGHHPASAKMIKPEFPPVKQM